MVYIERIKPYEYRLLCGMIFKSQTPSSPDENGLHNFPCCRCKVWHAYTESQVPNLRIIPASARDMLHASRLDKAILKDRIVRDLRLEWDQVPYKTLAIRHGVSYDTIFRIVAELGVSDYARTDGRMVTYS